MNGIKFIINEEIKKFLYERYDYGYDFYDRKEEIKTWIFQTFLYKNNYDFTNHIPWKVIPFSRLKKIWEDFISTHLVRDTKGLEIIEDIVESNTIKLSVLTELAGHTSYNPDDDFEDNIGYYVDEQINCIRQKYFDKNQLEINFEKPEAGNKIKTNTNEPCRVQINPYLEQFIVNNDLEDSTDEELRKALYDELIEKFDWYFTVDPKSGQDYISDYGLEPLLTLLDELKNETTPEDKVVTIDKMLNVAHQRSDLASWFVEGGSRALSSLSGYGDDEGESMISGKYNMSDYR